MAVRPGTDSGRQLRGEDVVVEPIKFKTVAELIAELQELPPRLPVALSSDEEGNNIRIVHGAGAEFVEKLEYNYMNGIHPDDLEEYDTWFRVAVIW